MLSILAWFTRGIGKTVAKWAAFVAVAVAVYWKIYSDGQAAERASQVAKNAAATRDRENIDDHVRKMDHTAVRDELSKWLRHD